MGKSKFTIGLLVFALCALIPLSTQSSTKEGATTVTLTSDNVVTLNEEVTGESVAKVVEKIKALDSKFSLKETLMGTKKPIYLFLYTPGGSIQAGLELIEQVSALKRPVHTITMFAASMGFQIAQNLGDRLVLKNGVLMSHRASGGFEGSFGGQTPSPIDGIYGLWLTRITEMDQKTVDRSNGKQTLESYQKQYAPDMWRTGTQAVSEGYADKVVKVICDKTLNTVTTHTIMFMGIIPVSYDLSSCPMNTAPMNIRVQVKTNKGVMSKEDFLSKSGGFGIACLKALSADVNTICADEASLTYEKLTSVTNDFRSYFEAKAKNVIRMRAGY